MTSFPNSPSESSDVDGIQGTPSQHVLPDRTESPTPSNRETPFTMQTGHCVQTTNLNASYPVESSNMPSTAENADSGFVGSQVGPDIGVQTGRTNCRVPSDGTGFPPSDPVRDAYQGKIDAASTHDAAEMDPNTTQFPASNPDWTSVPGHPHPAADRCQSNIIIFGETGVGKSSIINLIADKALAKTSNNALGCTFQHEKYTVLLDGFECRLWDTTGLDEGSSGTVPAAQAESNLKVLIQMIASAGGINLIIYCVRAGRLTKTHRRNYDIFYSKVCRKKAPIALVVTGLEHQEGEMETWWDANKNNFQDEGMRFDAHACITTLNTTDHVVQERRLLSRKLLRGLIVKYSERPPWKIEDSYISLIFPMFRDLFRPTHFSDRKTVRTVIVYDMAANHPVECPPGITSSWQKLTCRIRDHEYDFIRIENLSPSTKLQVVGGLLIFYTSPLLDTGISGADVAALTMFYSVAGGLTCPMIVVLTGCDDQEAAQICWDLVSPRYSHIQASLTFLPNAPSRPVDSSATLMMLVETLWVDPASLNPSKFQKAFTTLTDAARSVMPVLAPKRIGGDMHRTLDHVGQGNKLVAIGPHPNVQGGYSKPVDIEASRSTGEVSKRLSTPPNTPAYTNLSSESPPNN